MVGFEHFHFGAREFDQGVEVLDLLEVDWSGRVEEGGKRGGRVGDGWGRGRRSERCDGGRGSRWDARRFGQEILRIHLDGELEVAGE